MTITNALPRSLPACAIEKNTVWQRDPNEECLDKLSAVSDQTLQSGDIVTSLPTAIPCVKAISDELTASFNLYGKTNCRQRYRFETKTYTAKLF